MKCSSLVLPILLSAMSLHALFAAETQLAMDWPQYRGPNRDGMVAPGPKLIDSAPSGPRLLWKAEYGAMMLGKNGGSCSPVVSGGKVIFFTNTRALPAPGKKLITMEYLEQWGFNPELPTDLAKKTEDERRKQEYNKELFGKEAKPEALDTHIKAFLSKLDPGQAAKFAPTIEKRLRLAYGSGWDWGTLEAMHKNLNTEFKVRTEFEELYKTAPMHHNYTLGEEVNKFLKVIEEKSLDTIVALDALTGKEVWMKELPGLPGRSNTMYNWPASSTPAIVGDRCYVVGSAAVYCLSMKNGVLLWKSVPLNRCENSAPLVMNGKVCVVVESGLLCLDAETGKQLWKTPGIGGKYDWGSSVVPWMVNNKTILITGGGKAVSLDDGKLLWSIPKITGSCVFPLVKDNIAVFFGDKIQAYTLNLEAPELLWSKPGNSGDRVSSPIILQDQIYTVAGSARCLDLKTGEVRWEDKNHHTMFCMPAFADGKIFASADDGGQHGHDNYWPIVFCFKATPDKFEELWKLPPGTALAYCSSPAIANGKMYLHQLDGIACYDLTGPEQKAAANLPVTAAPGTPAIPVAVSEAKKAKNETIPSATNVAAVARGWRGDGTGRFAVENPPAIWDEKKNVKWRATVGNSHSTPVVSGSKVFVVSEKCTLTCLDRVSGKVFWKKNSDTDDVPAEFQAAVKESLEASQLAGMASCTPVCDNDGVYVLYGSGAVSRYDIEGNRKWFRFIKPVGLHYGHSASPLLADGKLVVYFDGLAALDAQTGNTLWENKTVECAYGCPVLMTLGTTKVVITPTGYVVRLADGKVLAKDIADGLQGDEFSISPLVQDDVVYYIDSSCSAVKLTLEGEGVKKKVLWTAELPEAAFGSPAIYNGMIFACTKMAHYSVLDAATGKPVLAGANGKLIDDCILELAPAGGNAKELSTASVYPSVTVAGKNVYVSNDHGQTFVLEASKTFKEIQHNRLPEGSGASLFFDGAEVFVRGGDYLYCVGP